MEAGMSAEAIHSTLYTITTGRAPAQHEQTNLPTGVFLSTIAEKTANAPPGKALVNINVKDLSDKFYSQGSHLYNLLTRVEFEHRHILPERFKEQGNQEEQYLSLKNRMSEIYTNKPPIKLLVTAIDPQVEFEQLQALERAFYAHFKKNHGTIEVYGNGQTLNPKILQVVQLAANHYKTQNTEVSFTLYNFALTPGDKEIIEKINTISF